MKLTISLLVPGLPFNGETIKTESLGGSESAGYYLAKALAQRGHRVTMFNNTPQRGTWDGVEYRPVGEWAQYASACPHDVAIVQRLPEQFARPLLTRLNVLWCHDLTLGRNAGTFKGVLWNVDKVAVLSQFMLDQYKRVLGLPDEQFFKTRNGVDLSLFGPNVRDKFKLIYAARPERGVDNLLEHIWPRLLKAEPRLRLHLCSYNNSVPHLDGF